MLVVNGAYRGLKAKLLSLNEKKFSVTIEIQQVRIYTYIVLLSMLSVHYLPL